MTEMAKIWCSGAGAPSPSSFSFFVFFLVTDLVTDSVDFYLKWE